jgi:hypothetical protein
MEALPLGILHDSNAAVKMSSIIEVDGVSIDTNKPIVSGSQLLEPRVLCSEFLRRAGPMMLLYDR